MLAILSIFSIFSIDLSTLRGYVASDQLTWPPDVISSILWPYSSWLDQFSSITVLLRYKSVKMTSYFHYYVPRGTCTIIHVPRGTWNKCSTWNNLFSLLCRKIELMLYLCRMYKWIILALIGLIMCVGSSVLTITLSHSNDGHGTITIDSTFIINYLKRDSLKQLKAPDSSQLGQNKNQK